MADFYSATINLFDRFRGRLLLRELQAALSLAYGAGLRASEVVSLKVSDIDSERIVIRVEQGKGRKDRYAMLPPLCSISCGLGGWRPVSAA